MDEIQKCSTCGCLLDLNNAYPNRTKNSLQSKCRKCANEYRKAWLARNKDHELARRKAYYQKNKEHISNQTEEARLKRKYNLSKQELEELKVQLDFRCQICKRQCELVVDHCHNTGRRRGLLCNACNHLLGNAKDDIAVLEAAIQYLKG